MAYEFFFSYTHANKDPYLKEFFDAVSEVVRGRRGLPLQADVGFFDERDLELGEDWDQSIIDALQTCRVFLAIWSPAYFKSEYCGKEWTVFHERCVASLGLGNACPPLIKPIVWIPFDAADVPPALSAGQFTLGDPLAVHNAKGFKYLLKQKQAYLKEYNDLVEQLADEIIDAAKRFPVPPLAAVSKLKDVLSAFPANGAAGGPAAAPRPPSGPKHVRFVYVAADPKQFSTARSSAAYTDVGGPDWKPYFPTNPLRIHAVLQHFVSGDELGFSSDELSFGPNLVAQVKAAWDQRQIVVLVVDGWSVHWSSQFRNILNELDQRLDYHWCVLVPWNDADPDSVAVRPQIQQAISTTFDRHANLAPNPLFFRDGIKSTDDLKSALREILVRLKEEIKKRAPVELPVPSGPTKSVIVGPSAQGR